MKKNKEITSRDVDFAKWYTDIVVKADLIDYSSVKGCTIIKPYGYAIWENIQKELDKEFKATGHQNVAMPLFIPESLLNVEKEHVKGFAPEVAWVTHGGNEKLQERLCIRPTSETLFCEHYAKIVKSYRDLPKLYNQWCNIVRWEKTTRPFLRSREILWQEGHTIHATESEAREETIKMLNVYNDFFKNSLSIPAIIGKKTEKEKFAGAVDTYTVEALMYNGVVLQSGTSHYFGTNFSKPFNITYADEFNEIKYVHQTSWGVSTRMIGAIIMVHGDDNGLVLPPKIAPINVIVIPIGTDKVILEKANMIKEKLSKVGISVLVDMTDKSPGFKFAEAEMKGIPLRIEVGIKELADGNCQTVRRDNYEKQLIKLDDIVEETQFLLDKISLDMYNRALERREKLTFDVDNLQHMKHIIETQPGFIKAHWCGSQECEEKIKEIGGIKSRCIPFEKGEEGKCIVCNKPSEKKIYWGIQY